jgi:hypothetical protein
MNLEEALRDFTNLVIPTVLDIQRQQLSDGPSSLTNSLRPFIILAVVNCISLVMISMIIKATLKTLNLVVTGINSGLGRLKHAALSARTRRIPQGQFNTRANPQRPTQMFEDEGTADSSDDQWCGKDWTKEEFSDSTIDPIHDALCEAFATLGIKSSATDDEIRAAYRRLIKRYHPDLYMRASPVEQARVNHIVVRVRHAYELLTRDGVNRH